MTDTFRCWMVETMLVEDHAAVLGDFFAEVIKVLSKSSLDEFMLVALLLLSMYYTIAESMRQLVGGPPPPPPLAPPAPPPREHLALCRCALLFS